MLGQSAEKLYKGVNSGLLNSCLLGKASANGVVFFFLELLLKIVLLPSFQEVLLQ